MGTSQLVKVLDDISTDLRDEHPNLNLAHIVFVAIRVFLNHEVDQFSSVLTEIFNRLEFSGRCVIICFNRWEMAVIRRFLRDHEEPSDRALSSLPRDRLVELFPLLATDKTYAVRRACRPIVPSISEIATN